MNYRLKIDYYDDHIFAKGTFLRPSKSLDRYYTDDDNYLISRAIVENNPDIFEPVEHKRWKPQDLQLFWYILSTGEVVSDRWISINSKDLYYNFGNCFPTEEAAIKARDAVKSLLLKMQEK